MLSQHPTVTSPSTIATRNVTNRNLRQPRGNPPHCSPAVLPRGVGQGHGRAVTPTEPWPFPRDRARDGSALGPPAHTHSLLDRRPALLDPAVDGVLVALSGAALGMRYRPAQPMVQQRPDMSGVMAHPGQPLDHQPDAVKGP